VEAITRRNHRTAKASRPRRGGLEVSVPASAETSSRRHTMSSKARCWTIAGCRRNRFMRPMQRRARTPVCVLLHTNDECDGRHTTSALTRVHGCEVPLSVLATGARDHAYGHRPQRRHRARPDLAVATHRQPPGVPVRAWLPHRSDHRRTARVLRARPAPVHGGQHNHRHDPLVRLIQRPLGGLAKVAREVKRPGAAASGSVGCYSLVFFVAALLQSSCHACAWSRGGPQSGLQRLCRRCRECAGRAAGCRSRQG